MNNLSKSDLDGKISMFVRMDLHNNHLLIGVEERINNDLKQDENINDDIVGCKNNHSKG